MSCLCPLYSDYSDINININAVNCIQQHITSQETNNKNPLSKSASLSLSLSLNCYFN